MSAYIAKTPCRLADPARTDDDPAIYKFLEKAVMKILGWIILVIFLIGLAVVLGLGKLIF